MPNRFRVRHFFLILSEEGLGERGCQDKSEADPLPGRDAFMIDDPGHGDCNDGFQIRDGSILSGGEPFHGTGDKHHDAVSLQESDTQEERKPARAMDGLAPLPLGQSR